MNYVVFIPFFILTIIKKNFLLTLSIKNHDNRQNDNTGMIWLKISEYVLNSASV